MNASQPLPCLRYPQLPHTHFYGCVVWITVPALLIIHASHARRVLHYHMQLYQQYETWLHNNLKHCCMQHVIQWTHGGFFHATTTPSYHTHFGAGVAWIMVPTPLIMYATNVRGDCLYPTWPYQWYEIPLHAIRHVLNAPRLIPCYRYSQWPYPFWWMCSMDYGPKPVVYVYMQAMWEVFALAMCVFISMIWNTAAYNISCIEFIFAISMLPLLPVTIHSFVGYVAYIMVPTPLFMHANHLRGVCPCPV